MKTPPRGGKKVRRRVPITCPICLGHKFSRGTGLKLNHDIRCTWCRGTGEMGYTMEECE